MSKHPEIAYESYLLTVTASEQDIVDEGDYLFEWVAGFEKRLEAFLTDERRRCEVAVELTVESKDDAEARKRSLLLQGLRNRLKGLPSRAKGNGVEESRPGGLARCSH